MYTSCLVFSPLAKVGRPESLDDHAQSAMLGPLATLPIALLLPARPTLRAAPPPLSPLLCGAAARAPPPQCNAAAAAVPAAVQSTTVLMAGPVKDTLLDVLVYGLIFGTAALTLYSIYVTLDESNKKAGGWTKPDDDDDYLKSSQATAYSKKNMIYNPATNEWRAKEKSEMPSASSSSSGGGGGGGADGGGNRYEKRIMKKEKQKQKKKR